MELKPGYKLTEVGVIPEDWEVKRVIDIGDVITGGTPSTIVSDYWGDEFPWITPTDISSCRDMYTSERGLSQKGLEQIRLLPANSVLVTCIASIGKNCILKLPGACNQQINAVLTNMENCSEFIYYLFEVSKQYLLSNAGITATSIISKAAFSELKFLIPPLPEQQAIADVLSDVDALLDGLDRLIEKKRNLKQAAMQQLLTGKTRLPGFEGEWELKKFGELTSPGKSRINPTQGEHSDFCVELEHIDQENARLIGWTETKFGSSLKSSFKSGDVLFGKLRAYLRKYWLADRDGVCSTEIWVFSPLNEVMTSSYLFQMVQMDWFIEVASTAYGTHMPRSDWKVIKATEVHIPLLTEQTAIAEVLSDMDAEISALEKRRTKTKALKQGMMQELLTGKTRLI